MAAADATLRRRSARAARAAVLFGASVQAAAAGGPGGYEIARPAGSPATDAAPIELPDLSGYTVDAVRERLPERYTGATARLVPIDSLYFLHTSNVIEMDRVWSANGVERPQCVLLGRGSYTLDMVHRQLADAGALSRRDDGGYLLARPIYVAPTGMLVLSAGDRLKMSTRDGVFIYSNGDLIVADSEVAAWDPARDDYDVREVPSKRDALYYARQRPRPYILAAEGSRTYFGNSRFYGLGYKGTSGTFGISLTPSASGGRLAQYLDRRPPATGWIIGNDIESLFFGYYSNAAEGVVIVGNVFADNVIYGVDPHDYSRGGIVARNLAQSSMHAHGIIFSRGVRESWIAENLAVGNAGSGVMLDRDSTDNRLVDNFVLANEGDGIAIYESDRNLVAGNTVLRNMRNGITMRNSIDVEVRANRLARNGRSGVEIAAVDISKLETRDFSLDPFSKRAHATVRRNTFSGNGRSAVEMRSANELTLHANRYESSGPLYFSGDLEPLSSRILQGEIAGAPQTVTARDGGKDAGASGQSVARPAQHGAGPLDSPGGSTAMDIVRRHAKGGSTRAMLRLARHHARSSGDAAARRETIYWYGRAIAHARLSAISELGIYLVSREAEGSRGHDEGLVLLSLAAALDDEKASADLRLLPDMLGTRNEALERARREAAVRLAAKRPWNAEAFADVRVSLTGAEARVARRRMAGLGGREARARAAASNESRVAPRRSKKLRQTYDARVTQKNRKRERLQRRLDAERARDAQAGGQRRAQLDRFAQRREGARLRVTLLSPAEREALERALEERLARINAHRSAVAKIDLSDLALPPALGMGAHALSRP